MVAELAREDWEDMRAEGLNPTLDDFDRLNQLALRLEAGAETTPANHPRIGWAGDVPFHEPTAAAIMWLQDFASRLDGDDARQAAFYFACAHATDPSAFDGLEATVDIRRAVKAWLRKLPCTVREMARACHFAAWGFDDAVAAETWLARERREKSGKSERVENMERLERLVTQAAALTGTAYAELLVQTPSRLNAMILAVQVEAGACLKLDTAKAQTRYSVTLKEIRDRLERERATSKERQEGRAQ